jgi:ArsR family transcriptional regulator
MKLRSFPQYEARARVAKALAHPSRMLMLDALAQRDLRVAELTELVGADQSTVSKHLAVLRDAGVVDMQRRGVQTVCTLKICCLNKFLECVESVLRQNLRDQQKAVGR